MITGSFIKKTKEFALSEIEKYNAPSAFHLDLSFNKAVDLANRFGANVKIVQMGTLLMDLKLGERFDKNDLKSHIQWSHKAAKRFLEDNKELTVPEKGNILKCILESHGADEFYSIESEICCNSDCYRFLSVKGILGGFVNFAALERPLEEGVELYKLKLEEKWNALTLNLCKQELKSQYEVLKHMLKLYK